MASVKLITPQNKPKYFKLTANIVVNGEKKRYYSRFEFDPKVLRTAKSRYAAAMAAAVRFESEMQQEALNPKKPEPVLTFVEVAEEYIQSCKARKAPSARLSGNYDANKNKANTTNNKETYLRKLQTVCPWFTSMEVNKISKGDYERLMDEMEAAVSGLHCVRGRKCTRQPPSQSWLRSAMSPRIRWRKPSAVRP